MQGSRSFTGSRNAVRQAALRMQSTSRSTAARQATPIRAALFDFLNKTGASPKRSSRANEIVDELLEITERTEAGIKASPAVREQVEELVEELEAYCPREPLGDDRILGEWEVVYASKPQTAGGPFRSPIGRTVFPGQRAVQIIEAPNVCINEVSYKTLGFVPGAARQEGVIEPLDGATFNLTFPKLDGKKGGPRQRVIQVAYLDDRIRVARFIPENEEEDEGSFYVFKRAGLVEEEEAPVAPPAAKQKARAQKPAPQPKYVYVDEEPAPEPVAKKRAGAFGTQIFGKKEGMATQAERNYYNKSKTAPPPPAPKRGVTQGSRAGTGSSRPSSREEQLAAKKAAEEERRKAREQAAAIKAQQEEERRQSREAAEQERRRAREAAEEQKRLAAAEAAAAREELIQKKAAAKDQFEQLRAVANESAAEARDAAATAKEAERSLLAVIRQASGSQSKVDAAMNAVETLVAQLKEAQSEEKDAEKEVLSLQKTVNELEKKARESLSLLAGKK